MNRHALQEMIALAEGTTLNFLTPLPGDTTARSRLRVQKKLEELRDALRAAQNGAEKLTGYLVPNELSAEDIQRSLDALKDLDDASTTLTTAVNGLKKAVEACRP